MNGFQSRVNNQPAIGAKGDFADANIRATVLASDAALVSAASPRSPIVGNFAWGDQATGQAFSRYYGETTAQIGFVHRENNALITQFLAADVLAIVEGQMVTLYDQGAFLAFFAGAASPGQKVFANYLDGSVYAADAGTSTQVASAMTGSLATTGILTVSALTGTLSVGDVLSGGSMPAGVAITAQLSGTAGGAGTYQTTKTGSTVAALTSVVAHDSAETDYVVESPVVPSTTITASLSASGVLTVTVAGSEAIEVGDLLTATGLSPNARVTAQLTGSTGGTGTYQTNQLYGPALTSRSFTVSQGQLAKISTWG